MFADLIPTCKFCVVWIFACTERLSDDRNKAVADGGVLFLLNGRVTTRVSRYTYGVRCRQRYDPWRLDHYLRKNTVYTCSATGEECVPNVFSIVLPEVRML